MENAAESRLLLRFGVFELDLRSEELRKDGTLIKLPPQPLKVLALLAHHAGQLVTREELQSQIWGKETFVDFEHGLNFCIARIREALGDEAETPRYIQTLPRRGYRFIAPVEALGADVGAGLRPAPTGAAPLGSTLGAVRDSSARGFGPEAEPPLRGRRIVSLAAGAVGLVAAALVVLNVAGLRDRILRGVGAIHESPLQVRSIAVLPLENLSGDPNQEYFADGMTDELITDLAKISSLRVISRTSSMRYKATRKPLSEIARDLNVDAVVEGTVVRSGDKVRITAQLIHAPTDRHLWAESYDKELRDVVATQNEVAREIAERVRTKLTPQEEAHLAAIHPVNPGAYDDYLRGRYYWNKFPRESFGKSIEYFEQAIQKEPQYAAAYAGLADSYCLLGWLTVAGPNEPLAQAKKMAAKAVEIDGTLAEAHTSLGLASYYYDWNWKVAEQEFKRAIELKPNYAPAHLWFSVYLRAMGRQGEAMEEAKRAQELDPFSPVINFNVLEQLYTARQYDEAIGYGRRLLELGPDFEGAATTIGRSYLQKSLPQEAVAQFERLTPPSGAPPHILALLGYSYAISGQRTRAKLTLKQLKSLSEEMYVSPYWTALLCIGLGEKDRAFEYLRNARQSHIVEIDLLRWDPMLEPVRSDPRYTELLRHLGLPP